MPEAPKPPRSRFETISPFIGKQIRNFELPTSDERRKIPENFEGTEQVREGLKLIAEYLELPIIEDHFRTDAERKAWREEIERTKPDVFAAYENNKLRMNTISWALTGLENVFSAVEWSKAVGYGDLPAAHERALAETRRLWKTKTPETLLKIEFIKDDLVPLLHHVFDAVIAGPPREGGR